MSLLRSVKKLVKEFKPEILQQIVIENFKEIIFLIFIFFLIIIIIILFVISGIKDKPENITKKETLMQKELTEKKNIQKKQFEYSKDILLTVDDFLLPDIKTFDLSFDYIEFLPNKYYTLPKVDIFKKDYEAFFDETVQKELEFDFEKRKTKK